LLQMLDSSLMCITLYHRKYCVFLYLVFCLGEFFKLIWQTKRVYRFFLRGHYSSVQRR
jgi:hypothetical protein